MSFLSRWTFRRNPYGLPRAIIEALEEKKKSERRFEPTDIFIVNILIRYARGEFDQSYQGKLRLRTEGVLAPDQSDGGAGPTIPGRP